MKAVLLALFSFFVFNAAQGQIQWQKTYGLANAHHSLERMISLQDGGYLLVGSQAFTNKTTHPYVVRTNASGDTLWTRTYYPFGLLSTFIYGACEDFTDGSLVLVGAGIGGVNTTDYNGYVMKLSTSGAIIWAKTTITPQRDAYNTITLGNDGSYIVSGYLSDISQLQKLNKDGTVRWSKVYPYSPTDAGAIANINRINNGYFIFVSSHYMTALTRTVRINEDGIEQYSFLHDFYTIRRVTADPLGNMVASSEGGVLKLNALGDTLWSKYYNNYSITAVQPTDDGNYIATFDRRNGWDGDIGLLKIAPDGTVIKDSVFWRVGAEEYSTDLVVDVNGNYVVAGTAALNGRNDYRFFLIKVRKWSQTLGLKEGRELAAQVKVYPNPAIAQTLFQSEKPLSGTLYLYNLQGRQVWQETLAYAREKVVPLDKLAPGIYVLRYLSEDGRQISRKIVKQ